VYFGTLSRHVNDGGKGGPKHMSASETSFRYEEQNSSSHTKNERPGGALGDASVRGEFPPNGHGNTKRETWHRQSQRQKEMLKAGKTAIQ